LNAASLKLNTCKLAVSPVRAYGSRINVAVSGRLFAPEIKGSELPKRPAQAEPHLLLYRHQNNA
jgi:hypothetical protein